MKKQLIQLVLILIFVSTSLLCKSQNIQEGVRLSHSGQYHEAEKVFDALLISDANNTTILTASGYNNSWSGNYKKAETQFLRVLSIDAQNNDARKGIAYTYLFEGDFKKAETAFKNLASSLPANEDLHFSLGLVYMNLLKKGLAQREFEKTLEINNAHAEAKRYLVEIKSSKKIIDIMVLGGLSTYSSENKFGLRQIQLGYHINKEIYLYGRYENALAMDNFYFLQNNFNSATFLAGGFARWHKNFGSKIEYSYRDFPGSSFQNIFQTEQSVFLPHNFMIKVGGAYISSNDLSSEYMLMSSISVPITKKLRAEPYYYFINRTQHEHRAQLNLIYDFAENSNVTVGVYNGTETNTGVKSKQSVFGLYAFSNFPITGPLSGMLLTRYERDAAARNSFIAAGGFKYLIDTKKRKRS